MSTIQQSSETALRFNASFPARRENSVSKGAIQRDGGIIFLCNPKGEVNSTTSSLHGGLLRRLALDPRRNAPLGALRQQRDASNEDGESCRGPISTHRPPLACGLSRKSPTVAPSGRVSMNAAQNSSTNPSLRLVFERASGSAELLLACIKGSKIDEIASPGNRLAGCTPSIRRSARLLRAMRRRPIGHHVGRRC